MAFDKEIEDAQKFLRNGSPPLGLAAGNNGHLERHPMKPELFLYNINGKYLQQNSQTLTFSEDDIRKYAGAQRLREDFAKKLNSDVIEKENKKPVKHTWVRGEIQGADKKESRSEEVMANLYLQAGDPDLKLEPNKGMFMKNPNNKEEYLYVVKGVPIKDNSNQIRSFNKGDIAMMAFEQRVKEFHEKEKKEPPKEVEHVVKAAKGAEKDSKQAPPQSQQWVPAKRSK